MLFARRDKLDFSQRLRAWLWPKSGWKRACGYVWRRVSRLNGSPHVIALGFAAGVFASFTPFIGFHFLIGFGVAWILGGNLIASALGTFFGNPLTFPFIWWSTLKVGNLILGEKMPEGGIKGMESVNLLKNSLDHVWPFIKPMVVAGLPMGIIVGVASYWLVRPAIAAYQLRRQKRFEEKQKRLEENLKNSSTQS